MKTPTVYILKKNNKTIRKKIYDAGIELCVCSKFNGAKWLNYHPALNNFTVHGIGYPTEDMTGREEIERFLYETKNPYFCESVEEFIEKINELKKNN